MVFIPTKPEEVTTEWMQTILPEVTVEGVDVTAGAGVGENFAVQVLRATVKGKKDGQCYEKSFILKVMPHHEWHKKMVKDMRLFEREVCFYKTIYPDFLNKQPQKQKVELSIPRCLYTDMKDDTGIIVLEDLKPLRYVVGDIRNGHSLEHCKLVLNELAKFHAMGYLVKYSETTPAKQLYPQLGEPVFLTLNDVMKNMYSSALERTISILNCMPGYEKYSKHIEKYNNNDILSAFQSILTPVEPYATFCHGDSHNGNMLFKYNEDKGEPVSIKLVDFQVVQYCDPTTDLVYYFTLSCFASLKKKSLKFLLEYYHSKLFRYLEIFGVTQVTKDMFSFDELMKRYYSHSGMLGFIQGISLLPGALITKDKSLTSKDDSLKDLDKEENKDKLVDFLNAMIMGDKIIKQAVCDVVEEAVLNDVI